MGNLLLHYDICEVYYIQEQSFSSRNSFIGERERNGPISIRRCDTRRNVLRDTPARGDRARVIRLRQQQSWQETASRSRNS